MGRCWLGVIAASAVVGASLSARADVIQVQHDDAHDNGKELAGAAPPGVGGVGPFASRNVELLAHMPLDSIGGRSGVLGNDIWGWTDASTGKEYALYGRSDGVSAVDISNPRAPVYLGDLPTATGNSAWRGIKVYRDHAFVVADANGNHGMQVFDLTNLRGVTTPQTFAAAAHYGEFANAHNIALNEETGYAYAVGTNTAAGGLHMVDVRDPRNPLRAGVYSGDGYTHDTQVVVYRGPDVGHAGREIAFNANEDTLTIVDVTDKVLPSQLSRTTYPQRGYAHQGWLTADHRYFLMNDERDETNFDTPTRTHIWDVSDLDAPRYVGRYEAELEAIDHNLYIHDGLVYEANYTSGLRILKPTDLAGGVLTEIGFIDTYPTDDERTFNGAWGVYPFFDSGSIIINDRQNGLFIVRSMAVPEPDSLVLATAAGLALALSASLRIRRSLHTQQE